MPNRRFEYLANVEGAETFWEVRDAVPFDTWMIVDTHTGILFTIPYSELDRSLPIDELNANGAPYDA